MSRPGLVAAVLRRMRAQSAARASEEPRPAPPIRVRERASDPQLEQLEAEARYHRDRYDLYHARVVSGSSAATSLTRLRELKRTATAAGDRLAHARRRRSE